MPSICTLVEASDISSIPYQVLHDWASAGLIRSTRKKADDIRPGPPVSFVSADQIVKAMLIRKLRDHGISRRQLERMNGCFNVSKLTDLETPYFQALAPGLVLVLHRGTSFIGDLRKGQQRVIVFDLQHAINQVRQRTQQLRGDLH